MSTYIEGLSFSNINPYQADFVFNSKAPNAELFWINLVFVTLMKLNFIFSTIVGIIVH